MRRKPLYLIPVVLVGMGVLALRSGASKTPSTGPSGGQAQELSFQLVSAPRVAPSHLVPSEISRDKKFLVGMKLKGGPALSNDELVKLAKSADDDLLSEDIKEELSTGKAVTRIQEQGTQGGHEPFDLTYDVAIVARTQDQGMQLARGLLALHAHWWQKDGRAYLLKEIARQRGCLEEQQKERERNKERYEKGLTVLKRYDLELAGAGPDIVPYIPPSLRTEVRAQQYILAINAAGSEAKAAEAKKLLNAELSSPLQQDVLGTIIVESEVELVGIRAQQKRVQEFYSAFGGVYEYAPNSYEQEIERLTRSIERLSAAIESGRYHPWKVVGKIRIHPITWREDN